jgi:hypothetical protein
MRQVDPAADRRRDRCVASSRFRCTNVRWTGETCGGLGSVTIRPPELLPVGGDVTLAFLVMRTLPAALVHQSHPDRPAINTATGQYCETDHIIRRFIFSSALACLERRGSVNGHQPGYLHRPPIGATRWRANAASFQGLGNGCERRDTGPLDIGTATLRPRRTPIRAS